MKSTRNWLALVALGGIFTGCSDAAGPGSGELLDELGDQATSTTVPGSSAGAAPGDGTSSGGSASSGGSVNTGGGAVVEPEPQPVDCSPIADHSGWELCSEGSDYCAVVFEDGAGCAAVCAAVGLDCAEVWENLDDGTCAADSTQSQLACDPGTGHQSDYCLCVGTGPIAGTGGTSSTGGASGDGGTTGDGGSGGSGGSGGTGTGGSTGTGDLSIHDPVPGYASEDGGTTGGGTNLSNAVTVSTMSALQSAASGSGSAIILVEPGTYDGTLDVGANKTIIGTDPGVRVTGNIKISGTDSYNIIMRNLAVQGDPCSSYDDCRDGDDAVYIGNGAHHVWIDHLDVYDGQDGNLDITKEGDFITVSWTKFRYTYDKEHRFSNLIAGSDSETQSIGKLRITYMNCHWGERVNSRQPRGRFGNIHMLNNYHNTGGGQIHGVGKDMALIAENSVYNEERSIWTDMGSPRGWRGIGNIGTGNDLNDSRGTVFSIPYAYTAMPASEVVAAVTSSNCGAGNTCSFE